MGKVIAFANRKGGSGKTTSAVNVAARISESKGRTLLIDIDPQGNAATALGVDADGRCISDLLLGKVTLKEVILPVPSYPNLFVVPASTRLSHATTQLVALEVADRLSGQSQGKIDTILSDTFTPYLHLFNQVIIDCPPTIGLLDNALYHFATDVVVPVKMAYLDTRGAKMNLEDIVTARRNGADVRISYVLPTFYRPREIVASETYDELRRAYGRLVARPIPQTAQIEQSQAIGQQTIFQYAPGSPAAKAYDDLTRRIMDG